MSSQDFDATEKILAIYSMPTTISIDSALFVNCFLQESTLSKDSSHFNLVVSILMLPFMSNAHDITSIATYGQLMLCIYMQPSVLLLYAVYTYYSIQSIHVAIHTQPYTIATTCNNSTHDRINYNHGYKNKVCIPHQWCNI